MLTAIEFENYMPEKQEALNLEEVLLGVQKEFLMRHREHAEEE